MKRLEFVKNLLVGVTGTSLIPKSQSKNIDVKDEYTFSELFDVHSGNDILIYPKYETPFYKGIEQSFVDRIDTTKGHVFLPIHELSIPIKEKYKWDDFLPIKYYFECVLANRMKFTTEYNGKVCFRFIKNKPDRMYLDVFVGKF